MTAELRSLIASATPRHLGALRKIGRGQKRHPETRAFFEQLADAIERAQGPAPTGYQVTHLRLPVAAVLAGWRDGDEHGWDTEFRYLRTKDAAYLSELRTKIAAEGIREPIMLGTDGRVWDGHHRLCIAEDLNLHDVPVEIMLPEEVPPPWESSDPESRRRRLLTVEKLITANQFAHPHTRAQRVDEFYVQLHRAAHTALRDRVKRVYLHALDRRTHWAHQDGPEATVRAVAYQGVAGLLQRAIEDAEREATPLDPSRKSGHYVSDGPCWCGDRHVYAQPVVPLSEGEVREAIDRASGVFGWQHLVRFSGQPPEWMARTLGAIVGQALAARAAQPVPAPMDPEVERGARCFHGTERACLSIRCGSDCGMVRNRFDRMHPCPACLVATIHDLRAALTAAGIDPYSLRPVVAPGGEYEAGESSGYADWVGALGEVVPADVELLPSAVAEHLAKTQTKVARCQEILAAWDAWDGSRGSDGQMHPDSSSPRDRERLRTALSGEDPS